MTTSVSNSMIHWTQMAFLEPTNEGLARINRCLRGVNFHRSDYPKMAWHERVIDLLTGLVLMVPILNLIVWVAMKTLGNAETLSNPFNPTPITPWSEAIDEANKPIIAEVVPRLPVEGEEHSKIDNYETIDQVNNDPAYKGVWEIKTYDEVHLVTRTSEVDISTSTYNLDWTLRKIEYKNIPKDIDVCLEKKNNVIKVIGTNAKTIVDTELTLKDPTMTWIQQPSIGLRSFILSKKSSMHFYGIDPTTKVPNVAELTVTRIAEKVHSKFPKYGKGVCVQIGRKSGLASYISNFITLYESWHDPKTGKQFTSDYGVPLFLKGNSRLVHSN